MGFARTKSLTLRYPYVNIHRFTIENTNKKIYIVRIHTTPLAVDSTSTQKMEFKNNYSKKIFIGLLNSSRNVLKNVFRHVFI